MSRKLFFLVVPAVLFLLACRTMALLSAVEPTATRAPRTQAALRPTFTAVPTDTETPVPTDTPIPTDTPEPTEPPTDTPIPPPPPTRRPPTATQPPPPTNTPRPEPTATIVYEWELSGNTSCSSGGDNESSVTGTIRANNAPAVGQRVQGSSGPGGEPISDVPAMSSSTGNYKVTFICGGKACTGDFWIWMVSPQGTQISPFVKFSFNNNCRRGTANFVRR
jgi:hypothetical protein